ncbi:MAG: protein kinase [Planctomycetes bacterium]|nr:protein kinase [Planctomycetota bacterium]
MEQAPSVIANCKIISRIGQGGMGSVYRAVHQHLGRSIALKLLPAEFTRSEEYVTRFLREARAVANLSHPNVVTVHDAGEQDGQYYIAMELIEGGSLGVLMRKRGRVPEKAALEFLAQAGKGLAAAHDRGLIHRDIKPENMLVNKDGILKIVDFGLVLESTAQSHLTKTGTFLGTPVYMSPEQCDGAIADARSDLYSLGASFYTLLTGKPPFNAPTALGILYKHKFEAPPDPREADPTITEKCSQVLLKLMAKKREDRYQSAKELVKDAEAALKTAPDLPEDWSFDVIMGEILASMPEPPSITASPMTPGAMPTLTPGRSSPLSRTPATVANSSPPTLTGTPTGTPFPGTTGPLMPTLLTPGAGRTPAPLSTPGMEPTLVQPGSSSSRTHGATPPPGPLGEMYTPTQAVQAQKRAPWIWPAVAAAALLAVGLGGYFGYGAYQQSKFDGYVKECDEILKAPSPNLDDATTALTLARNINPTHADIARLQAEIAAAKAARDLDLQKKGYTGYKKLNEYKALLEKANEQLKAKNLVDARKTLEAALPIEGELVTLGTPLDDVGTLASDLVNIVSYDLSFQAGEKALASGDLKAALAAFQEAARCEVPEAKQNMALQKATEVKYRTNMAKALEADKAKDVANWEEPIKAANNAWRLFSDTDEQKDEAKRLYDRLVARQQVEADLAAAKKLAKEGDLKGAENAVELLRSNLDPEKNKDRVDELAKLAMSYRLERMTNAANKAKADGNQDEERRLLGELIALNPPNAGEFKGRLDAIEKAIMQSANLEKVQAEAQKAYDDKKWDTALLRYKDVDRLKPEDPAIQAKLLECEVRADAVKALADEQNSMWSSAKDQYEKALAKLQNSKEQDALKGELVASLARINQQTGKISALVEEAAKAAKENRHADAIAKYEELVKQDPEKKLTYERLAQAQKDNLAYMGIVKAGDEALKSRNWAAAIEQYGKASETRPSAQVDARRALAENVRNAGQAETAKEWKTAVDAYAKALSQWTAANIADLPELKRELEGKKAATAKTADSIGKLVDGLEAARKGKDLVGQMRASKDLLAQDLPKKDLETYGAALAKAIADYKKIAEDLSKDARKMKDAKAAWENLALYDAANKAAYDTQAKAIEEHLAKINSEEQQVADAIGSAQGYVGKGDLAKAASAMSQAQRDYGSNPDLRAATAALQALLDAETDVTSAKETLSKGMAAIKSDLDKVPQEKSRLEGLVRTLEEQPKPGVQDFLAGKFKNAASSAKLGGESAMSSVRSALEAASTAIKNKTKVTQPKTPEGVKTRKRHDNAGEE